MSGTPTLNQVHFRARSDQGAATLTNNNTPRWIAAEDTNFNWYLDYRLRVRFVINNTGTGVSGSMLLMYSKNGAAYTAVTTSSTNVRSIDVSTSTSPSIIPTTAFLLTAGAGVAESGIYTETGNLSTVANGGYEEDECGIVLRSADLVVGDTIDLRVYDAGPVAFTTYTVTLRITVVAPPTTFGSFIGTFSIALGSILNPSDAVLVNGRGVVTVGDLVVALAGEQTSQTCTAVTDNLGNTYAAADTGADAGTIAGRLFYSRVTVAGTITVIHFACTASTNDGIFTACLYNGPFATSPLDATLTDTTDDLSPFLCPATGTLTQADELVVGWSAHTALGFATTAPMLSDAEYVQSSVISINIASNVVSATTDTTPQFTSGTNPTDSVQGTACFKKDAGVAFIWSDSQVNQGYDPFRNRMEIVGY